jgi:hypothetical protein
MGIIFKTDSLRSRQGILRPASAEERSQGNESKQAKPGSSLPPTGSDSAIGAAFANKLFQGGLAVDLDVPIGAWLTLASEMVVSSAY